MFDLESAFDVALRHISVKFPKQVLRDLRLKEFDKSDIFYNSKMKMLTDLTIKQKRMMIRVAKESLKRKEGYKKI